MTALSGGQKRRLLIARALLAEPLVLILDEPLASLDLPLQARLRQDLERLAGERGLAVVLVSHDLRQVARLARRVVVLEAGRLAETGDLATFLTAPRTPIGRALVAAAGGLGSGAPGEDPWAAS